MRTGDVVICRTYKPRGEIALLVGGDVQPILLHHSNGIFGNELGTYYASWKDLEVIGHIELEELWQKTLEVGNERI